nr:zinc finger, CCHC-type [Tanacetum cinerariifolium]
MPKMSKDDLIHAIDEDLETCTTYMSTKITRPPFKSITRKSVILELTHSNLCDFHDTPYLGNKKGCRVVVRLPDLKRETLGKKGIDCIFVGYAEHSKAYSDVVLYGIHRVFVCVFLVACMPLGVLLVAMSLGPKDTTPNSIESQRDDHSDDVLSETPEPRKGEADVILGIKIKCANKRIVITQSHYIEKILKKFNREDCSPMSTPMDSIEKLKPNIGKPVDQLEYSRAIGCLMYAMTSTRPDIAYAVGRLSRFTSNPSRQRWHAITMAFKKQTCITGSTIESEFIALAAA